MLLVLYFLFASVTMPSPHIYPLLLIAASVLAACLGARLAARLVRAQPPRFVMMLDRHSFHVYLIHQFVILLVLMYVPLSGPAAAWSIPLFVFAAVASLAISVSWQKICSLAKNLYLRVSVGTGRAS